MNPSKRISARTFALAGVLSFLVIQLNIFFAWTSHVGQEEAATGFFFSVGDTNVRAFLAAEVNDFVNLQLGIPGVSSFFTGLASGNAFAGGFNADHPGGGAFPLFVGPASSLAMRFLIDAEVVLFVFAVFVISLFLFHNRGIRVALLRAFEITSLTILPLGLEIFYFDYHEYNLHASDIQVLAGAAWFTNADVLYLSSAILGAALLIDATRYAIRKGSPPDQVTVAYPPE